MEGIRTEAEITEILEEIDARVSGRHVEYSRFATLNDNEDAGRRLHPEIIDPAGFVRAGVRRVYNRDLAPFERDIDRIVFYTMSKLSGKAQVYGLPSEHLIRTDTPVSTRLSHSLELSRIAEKAARALGLNMSLVVAQALGHDIGHSPFGHVGEKALGKIGEKYGLGRFHHSSHSLRILDHLAQANLTFAVRNGIVMHDGEADESKVIPNTDADEVLLQEFLTARKGMLTREDSKSYGVSEETPYRPSTIEGCLLRVCDAISYVGSDFEDAVRLGIVDAHWLPTEVERGLGRTNAQIIDTLFNDLILHSYDRPYIGFSPAIIELLKALKKFNRERIYWMKDQVIEGKETGESRCDDNPHLLRIKKLSKKMELVFEKLLADLKDNKVESPVFAFKKNAPDGYVEGNSDEQIAFDCLAGMTDAQFIRYLGEFEAG